MAYRTPKGLRKRGTELWKRLGLEPNTPEGVMAEESCRIADQMDQLFGIIDGTQDEDIIREAHYKMGELFNDEDQRTIHLTVKMPNVQSELRQQQALFRQMLLSTIGVRDHLHGRPEVADPEGPSESGKAPKEASSAVSEFSSRRKTRNAA